jgi:SapC
MPQFAAVSRERYANKKWLRFSNYGFAAGEMIAPIVAAELARAAPAMPCAFLQQSGRYTLVAVLSLIAGRNMFVAPDGRWLGLYVPAVFRLYPFRVLPTERGDLVLCVDEQSNLVVDGSSAGEEFFDSQGNPAPVLKPAFDAAMALETNRKSTELAVEALAQAGVKRPWEIKVKSNEGERPISGLHRLDEAALHALPDETFLNLRKTAALPLAYTQMLSMGQLGLLQHLARLQTQAAAPPPPPSSQLLSALPDTLDDLLENLKDDLRPPR